MLTGDRVKFLGLIFGVAFSTLLITQQLTIFVNLLMRGAAAANEVVEADIWVMDPAGRTTDVTVPMPATYLSRVRGVPGVAWATPIIRGTASLRTAEGDLEPINLIGVDDQSLVGLPRTVLRGDRRDLFEPDAVFVDGVGGRKLFPPGVDPIGVRLELNDQRAIIRGIVDANPTFTSTVILYTRYSNALNYIPGTRNRMSFILVRTEDGQDARAVAERITRETGLKARTARDFASDGVNYIVENSGIPINFGITVALGFIVGVAIVGLTFSLFIRDNIKQFGALKAIGVTNHKIRMMVAAQSAMVGLIGYGIGVFLAVMFIILGVAGSDAFKGFYTPWPIPLLTALFVLAMILLTGFVALRTVLKTEPAEVFR